MKKILLFAVALLLPIANAANAPDMKEGLWSIRIQTIDNPGNKKDDTTSTLCRNHAYDKSVEGLANGVKKNCTKYNESFQGGKYSIDSQCTVAGTVIATKGTATYIGDTSAHAENHTGYSPAFYGVSESTMIMDQKYIGNCPAGAQPGDRTTADGKVTHLGRH
jgi:Protein of unknown function (DUF3617)